MLQALKTVNETLGATTIIITHNAGVADMAHRVITFSDGQVGNVRVNTERANPEDLAW